MIKNYSDLQNKMKINHEKILSGISNNIINHMHKLKKEGALIGLSGGVDSAVVTDLCVKALGNEKVKVLLLPDSESNRIHLYDAQDFARYLKVKYKIVDITHFLRDFNIKKYGFFSSFSFLNKLKSFLYKKAHNYYQKTSGETPFVSQLKGLEQKPYHAYIREGQAILNLKHRLRMILLYYYAERENRMVVGCTNKTEKQIGLFVKYGCDHLADLMPIIGFYKTQIYQLARYLELPARIIQKQPSPDLLPGLDDRTLLGMSYKDIDLVLLARENNLSSEMISKIIGVKVDTVNSIIDLVHYAKDIVGVT
jgi:NAD+ synthase